MLTSIGERKERGHFVGTSFSLKLTRQSMQVADCDQDRRNLLLDACGKYRSEEIDATEQLPNIFTDDDRLQLTARKVFGAKDSRTPALAEEVPNPT
jgi:hypothetical protein